MKTFLGATLALCALSVWADGSRLADPRLVYRSAFEAPLLSEARPADWRASNEQMRRLGGHAGHLRGTPRPDADAAAAAGQTATPAPAPPAATATPAAPPAHRHHGGRP